MITDTLELIERRAHKILLREQDRCDFQIYVKMAAAELLAEGAISEIDAKRVR